tara:strand:+ start:976 stop:1638 length:663 start_codon:yes stop_codon:yes gene_type:complete
MSDYFNRLPNLEYVSRLKDAKISDYITVKNFFKKGILREDIFENLMSFQKYKIIGNERPDNVAKKIYDNPNLDWLVLVSNNIIHIQNEWPMTQNDLDDYLLSKYGNYETLYGGIHHYESKEVKDENGVILFPEGLYIDQNYEFTYTNSSGILQRSRPAVPITNYDYELKIEDDKRNISLLKPKYVNLVIDDLKSIMEYKKGSTQYVNGTLKRADNIKLYS